MHVWDTASGRELIRLKGHTSVIASVAFSSDGTRIATGSWDKTARIWDAATGQELQVINQTGRTVRSVAFGASPTQFATASCVLALNNRDGCNRNFVSIWDVATGHEVISLQGPAGSITSLAYSRDGTQLVASSKDKTSRLWNIPVGRELPTLIGHTASINGIAFSPDSQHIVTASEDKTAHVWDAATGQLLTTLRGNMEAITTVAFSPDGKQIATGHRDRTIRIWDAQRGNELRAVRADVAFDLRKQLCFGARLPEDEADDSNEDDEQWHEREDGVVGERRAESWHLLALPFEDGLLEEGEEGGQVLARSNECSSFTLVQHESWQYYRLLMPQGP